MGYNTQFKGELKVTGLYRPEEYNYLVTVLEKEYKGRDIDRQADHGGENSSRPDK